MKSKKKYHVGKVIVEIDNTPKQKFMVLRMRMDNWLKKNKHLPVHRIEMREWADDHERFIKLKELFEFHKPNFIKKKHMIEVNKLFRKYE
tara:strand:+ start:505 stop:774 length:270 start_codon:yes stop_codon:yes gene_type:complete